MATSTMETSELYGATKPSAGGTAPSDASPTAAMDVPEQIVVSKKDRKSSKCHRGSSRKEKVAKKRSNSSGKHERKRRSRTKDGKDGERKRRHKHRKSKRSKSSDPDPNDPETLAKSRELLLAAMGVKKQPDVAPCFVSNTTSLDSNPVYQSNKERISKMAHSQSETMLSAVASRSSLAMETSVTRSMDDLTSFHSACRNTETASDSNSEEDSEYDQYVEFSC